MTFLGLAWSGGAIWLAVALLLAVAEMLAPGYFLIFLAAGAALTGLGVWIVPGLPLIVQTVLFGLFAAGAAGLGRRWYRRSAVPTSDPLLNDRAARLIGTTVEVCEPIRSGEGRVRVGDGVWTAQGPDAVAGSHVRVVGATGTVLLVEPTEDRPDRNESPASF